MTVGAGERISQIKIYNNPSDNVMTGKVLFVATQKGDEGKVYKAVFNEMSGLLLEEPLEYTSSNLSGICFINNDYGGTVAFICDSLIHLNLTMKL